MAYIPHKINEQLHIPEFFSFFTSTYSDKYVFEGESHDFWETVYVIDGNLCVSDEDRVYEMSKGEIIFHHPLNLHKFHITSNETKLLIFSYTLKGELAEFFSGKVFKLSKSQQQIISDMLDYIQVTIRKPVYTDNNHPLTEEQYHQILAPFETNPVYSQTIAIYIYRLFLDLTENSKKASPTNTSEAVIFGNAVKYMNDNIYNSISVSDIAKHCNVSLSGIKRIFNKYAGLGVHKYFLALKLNTAAELLEHGLSVTETAGKLCFSSQAYFSKAYKRELGKSPSSVGKYQ